MSIYPDNTTMLTEAVSTTETVAHQQESAEKKESVTTTASIAGIE